MALTGTPSLTPRLLGGGMRARTHTHFHPEAGGKKHQQQCLHSHGAKNRSVTQKIKNMHYYRMIFVNTYNEMAFKFVNTSTFENINKTTIQVFIPKKD
jgi:hypothetical protein